MAHNDRNDHDEHDEQNQHDDHTARGKRDGGDSKMFERLQGMLADRGLTPGEVPNDDDDDDDADADHLPGSVEYHRQKRVDVALAQLERVTPPRYRDATVDHPQVIAWADAVIADPLSAPSLLLTGTTGTGKTHQAYGALRRIAEAGPDRFTAISVNAADLYGELRPTGAAGATEARLRQLRAASLLHIDDLCAEKGSPWVEEVTYRLLNGRYNTLLPTLITTNLPPQQLAEAVGDRVASRLREMCDVVAMTGSDRRATRR